MLSPYISKVEFCLKRIGLGNNDFKIGRHATLEQHSCIGNCTMKSSNPLFSDNFLGFYLLELHKGIGYLFYRLEHCLFKLKFRLLSFYF